MRKDALFVILLSRLITNILTNPIPEDIKPVVGSTTAIMKPSSENTTHLHQYHEKFLSLWAAIALTVVTVVGAAGFAISMSVPNLLASHDAKRGVDVYDHGTGSLGQQTSQHDYEWPEINVLETEVTASMRGNIQTKSEASKVSVGPSVAE